jgi:cell division protein FtsB
MFTTIVIVLLLGWCIFLTVRISKLTQRIEILHKETNNRIYLTDKYGNQKLREEVNLLESKITEVKTNMVSLLNQKLDDEIDDVKKLIPPTNEELLKEVQQMRDDFLALRQNF